MRERRPAAITFRMILALRESCFPRISALKFFLATSD
jgi:hypothetical protein